MGRIAPSQHLDHSNNDPTDNRRSNLVGLCASCHSVKTQQHEYFLRTGKHLPVKGCDVFGVPLDPLHAWNCEKSPEAERHEPHVSLSFNANRENEP